jgi:hypothetical protein
MPIDTQSRTVPQTLDLSFVNLWALLRKLSQDGFIGRVHVELNDYAADVFVNGSNRPMVREIDRAAGIDVIEEAALHRVVLRTRGASGTITIFEGADDEAVPVRNTPTTPASVAPPAANDVPPITERDLPASYPIKQSGEQVVEPTMPITTASPTGFETSVDAEWSEVVKLSGDLIKGVDQALTASGVDFASTWARVALELADDYTFLDPMQGRFVYEGGTVTVSDELTPRMYIAGLSEALRRTIDKVAIGDRARRVRERVALEFALLARQRPDALKRTGFYGRMDSIAGTKVI